MDEIVKSKSEIVKAERWSDKQQEVLRSTVAKGATDAEFWMFENQCQRTRLDPFVGQIYMMIFNGKRGRTCTIGIKIDGQRVISERSGKYRGMLGPYWCGPDGEWKDVWVDPNRPLAAKVGILRSDFQEPVWGIAYAKESYDDRNLLWKTRFLMMLAKCAEANGRRIAFPQDLSGLYIEEEMSVAREDQPDDHHDLKSSPSEPEVPGYDLPIPRDWLPKDLSDRIDNDHLIPTYKQGYLDRDIKWKTAEGKEQSLRQFMAYNWDEVDGSPKQIAYRRLKELFGDD